MWVSGKRYYDLKSYFSNRFRDRVYKISVDAGFTCPNRDGSRGIGGCSYCDPRGSALRAAGPLPSVGRQIAAGRALYAHLRNARRFMVYFQSGTNTYAPLPLLERRFAAALAEPDVVGLAVGTRPDAVTPAVIDLLAGYAESREVWLEYGLQSVHDRTLQRINRGHDFAAFQNAVELTVGRGIRICAHLMFGLPGESDGMMLETVERVSRLPIDGVKFHSLLLLRGTSLHAAYRRHPFPLLSCSRYVDLVGRSLTLLPPEVVVQRLTAEGYRDIFVGPPWVQNKLAVLNRLHALLERRGLVQGAAARVPVPAAEPTGSGRPGAVPGRGNR
ncbi:MAG: TIGR01212 family radical SAM protein [Deltaproteobacteria bacterium]|nr:TIGR01212 family radical SAM protein [Candidatus Anaeroferrophillacea bacterium]